MLLALTVAVHTSSRVPPATAEVPVPLFAPDTLVHVPLPDSPPLTPVPSFAVSIRMKQRLWSPQPADGGVMRSEPVPYMRESPLSKYDGWFLLAVSPRSSNDRCRCVAVPKYLPVHGPGAAVVLELTMWKCPEYILARCGPQSFTPYVGNHGDPPTISTTVWYATAYGCVVTTFGTVAAAAVRPRFENAEKPTGGDARFSKASIWTSEYGKQLTVNVLAVVFAA